MLDSALREAAVSRGVQVRLLVSCWLNTDPRMFPFLRSLQALSDPAASISVDVVRQAASGLGLGGGGGFPISQLVSPESLHRAGGKPLEHPIRQGEPQQVHGHRAGSLYR